MTGYLVHWLIDFIGCKVKIFSVDTDIPAAHAISADTEIDARYRGIGRKAGDFKQTMLMLAVVVRHITGGVG